MSSRFLVTGWLVVATLLPNSGAVGQERESLFGTGPTLTYSRPGDRHLWGVGVRQQWYPRRAVVSRLRGSVQFTRSGTPDPLLLTAGFDLGLTVPRGSTGALIAPSLTLGAGVFYYATGRAIDPNCYMGTCNPVNRGYDPGLLLVWTGTLGFELAMRPPWSGFIDITVHAPSGIGRNGFAGDPHAGFPGLAFGLMRSR